MADKPLHPEKELQEMIEEIEEEVSEEEEGEHPKKRKHGDERDEEE